MCYAARVLAEGPYLYLVNVMFLLSILETWDICIIRLPDIQGSSYLRFLPEPGRIRPSSFCFLARFYNFIFYIM